MDLIGSASMESCPVCCVKIDKISSCMVDRKEGEVT